MNYHMAYLSCCIPGSVKDFPLDNYPSSYSRTQGEQNEIIKHEFSNDEVLLVADATRDPSPGPVERSLAQNDLRPPLSLSDTHCKTPDTWPRTRPDSAPSGGTPDATR